MLYIIIREGDSPEEARPVATISDQAVVRRVVEALAERLLEASGEPNTLLSELTSQVDALSVKLRYDRTDGGETCH